MAHFPEDTFNTQYTIWRFDQLFCLKDVSANSLWETRQKVADHLQSRARKSAQKRAMG
jgi:hypothetical protein